MCQDSLDDLSEITVSDKTELTAELSKFTTGSKSSGSLKNSSESNMIPAAVESSEAFAATARTTAIETTGIHGLSNGQVAGEHASVGNLWPDLAAMQLGNSDMMTFPGPSMSLYGPLMVNYMLFMVNLNLTACSADNCMF